MKQHLAQIMALVVPLTLGFAACTQRQVETTDAPMETAAEEALQQEVVTVPDTTGASVWDYLQKANYRESWPMWPGKGALYEGQEPHGMLLTTYVNNLALGAINTKAGRLPNAAVVVKENYMPDSTLAAITVMYKVAGFNSMHNDWFFVKYRPSGQVDTAPKGMALEGRVPGCQACHGAQKANDYLFTGVVK